MSSKDPPEVSERSHLKVFLPRKLVECLPKCPVLPKEQLRWNTNEEIASYLITFEKHDEWLSCSPKTRPQNGSVILYNRKKVKYRKDGYCWKKRKDGKTTREDHMKLKVQGVECLYGCYVHSSIVPTFHRRCYWLLQNPDIVLVHYLNVPAMEECGRPCAPQLCSPPLCAGAPPICAATADPREWLKWSQEELVAQLRPMFHGVKWGCGNGGAPPGLSLEQLVQHILERHQARPPPRTHACLCAGGLGTPGHKCGSTKHRIISPKVERGGGGGAPGDAPKPAPSSPDTTQPSPGLGGGTAPPEGPRAPSLPPARGLPLLVVASLGGGAAPGGPEQPLGLTPSQHLVTPEGTCPTAPPPPAAFDPDCFLNSPRRGQTYGCEAEAPPGAPPPPPAAPPKLEEEEEEEKEEEEEEKEGVKQGTVPHDPLSAAPLPQPPFPHPFPELLTGDAGVPPNPREAPHAPHLPSSPPAPPSDSPVAITDFSPEWSYPEGGVKVLITGPWGDPGAYSCLFDRTSVPAALVQPGVLRCYCPPHEAGVAALRVACPPRLLSAAAPFEYRARGAARGPPGAQLDWLALDEAQFRLSILERLEQLETRLGALPPPAPLLPPRGAPSETRPEQGPGSSFEARVVAICEAMMARPGWPGTSPGTSGTSMLAHGVTFRGMTLLHLAAAQGYASLVEALRRWRMLAADSLELEQEIDPLNVDHFSCTPLMWACALGHREAAERLCRWDRRALAVPDTLGRLPLALARARGHLALVTRLEELQVSPTSPRCHLPGLRIPSPLSASPDTGLSTASSLSSPSGLSEGPGSVPLPPGPPGPSEDESWGVAVPPSPPEDALAPPSDTLQAEVVTLARQIIEATPERIKQEAPGGPPGALGALGSAGGTLGTPGPAGPAGLGAAMAWLATYLESVDRPPAPPHRAEAASRGSPGVPERPPPPSAAGWAEFLNASGGARGEGGAVALLTLSDQEQHELYEAARLVQGAFRKYRGRRLKEQQELAAAVIQRCYRKYKQFALFQRMTQAAILIQSKFRSYAEQKRFQRRRRAAVLIQQRFRSLRQHRSTFLTLKQDQAARKIMRFLRRCRHRMEELKQNKEVDSLQTRGLAS